MNGSNVIPFRKGNRNYCFLVCDGDLPDTELLPLLTGYPVLPLHSEEELRRALIFFKPTLILVRSDLNWGNPIDLISQITQASQAPTILVLKKTGQKHEESVIKKAYQAGVFDILRLPMNRDDLIETLDLPMKLLSYHPMAF